MLPFDDDGGPPTYTVKDVCDRIRSVMQRSFPGDMWVQGEVQGLKVAANGYGYLRLVEPSLHGHVRAAVSAVIKAGDLRRIERTLARAGGLRLDNDIEVRVLSRIEYYTPRGSLQLAIKDIDPEFLLGRLAADRDRVLAALQGEGLLDRNKQVPMPVMPLRVGLLTSGGSAAYNDFVNELAMSGIGFHVLHADVRVQGANADRTIPGALRRMVRMRPDVIAVVRGGGSKTDLAAFDREQIARTIATLPVPVITGIGHEIDSSIADAVAHRAFKTPTACAQFLVGIAADCRRRGDDAWVAIAALAADGLDRSGDKLEVIGQRSGSAARRTLALAAQRMEHAAAGAGREPRRHLMAAGARLDAADGALARAPSRLLGSAAERLDTLDTRVRALDPAAALGRGWSITTRSDGSVVRSVDDVEAGDRLVTRVADGTIASTVEAPPAIDPDA